MNTTLPIPTTMKAPGDFRPGIWRGRVLQVKITSHCDLDCRNCSVAVGTAKKLKRQFNMTPEHYREALRSLKGFPGVIGMFGGNPAIHPQFEELCRIFREEIPNKAQRGLWSNRLFGKGAICRETFNPGVSNLNVHGSQEAWDEMKRDWPESTPLAGGLSPTGDGDPSHHGPIFGSMLDLGMSGAEMWEKVGGCYVNQTWSALITQVAGNLVGYFCEIAGTMAEVTADASHGVQVNPGWWKMPMSEFEHQVRHYCTRCLIPMNGTKVRADDPKQIERFTKVWLPLFPVPGRNMVLAEKRADIGEGEPATKYLNKGVMPAKD